MQEVAKHLNARFIYKTGLTGDYEQEQHEYWRVNAKAVADEFEVYIAELLG